MKVVIQRVASASVSVEGVAVGSIGNGMVALIGVAVGDSPETSKAAARKTAELRIFADEDGKMNRSLLETGGSALVISQFTVLGDTSRGRRPSFVNAAAGDQAEPLVDAVAAELRSLGVPVEKGRFGANMQVSLVNDGPVTVILDI